MKKVDGYISDLLFKHDCVILPDFGGFVASYAPARLHPSKHTLFPPSKDIMFNARLHKNDGLLANYIAEQEKVSYTEAMLRISEFSSQCLSALKAREPVIFENIGTFAINREEKIEFTPSPGINYLEDAYGLTSLVAPPPKGKQRKPRTLPTERIKISGSSHGRKKTVPRLAFAAVLIVVTALWGYYHSPLLKDIYTNYSGIIPLIRATHQQVPMMDENENNRPAVKEEIPPSPIPEPALMDSKMEQTTEIALPASHPAEEPAVYYYIIAGAFQDPGNAESLIERLRSKGFDARMAGRTKGGLYRVCYGQYPDKKQATQNLETIQLKENPDAWMFVE